jgi:hypothetical protein
VLGGPLALMALMCETKDRYLFKKDGGLFEKDGDVLEIIVIK